MWSLLVLNNELTGFLVSRLTSLLPHPCSVMSNLFKYTFFHRDSFYVCPADFPYTFFNRQTYLKARNKYRFNLIKAMTLEGREKIMWFFRHTFSTTACTYESLPFQLINSLYSHLKSAGMLHLRPLISAAHITLASSSVVTLIKSCTITTRLLQNTATEMYVFLRTTHWNTHSLHFSEWDKNRCTSGVSSRAAELYCIYLCGCCLKSWWRMSSCCGILWRTSSWCYVKKNRRGGGGESVGKIYF